MKHFHENKNTSDILFHQFFKCAHIMRSAAHHGHGECDRHKHHHHDECGHHRHRGHLRDKHHHEEMKLKIGQGRLLAFLLEDNGISQKELAELLRISPASVNELVNKLENGGYITRTQNEDDKRVTNILLTEGGRFYAQKMEEARGEAAQNMFSALNEDEQKQLLNLLEKLINSLSSHTDKEECDN